MLSVGCGELWLNRLLLLNEPLAPSISLNFKVKLKHSKCSLDGWKHVEQQSS